LIKIVEWKFEGLKGRKKRILKLVKQNDDGEIVNRISNFSFCLDSKYDAYKVDVLQTLYGVGTAVASTILTFYNPREYAVFDIHVWREVFGKEPKNLFTTQNYLTLLSELRKIANKYGLDVRAVEKAFFKKNFDEAHYLTKEKNKITML